MERNPDFLSELGFDSTSEEEEIDEQEDKFNKDVNNSNPN